MNTALNTLIAAMAECHARLDGLIDGYLISIGINPEADDIDLQIAQHEKSQTIWEILDIVNPLAEHDLVFRV